MSASVGVDSEEEVELEGFGFDDAIKVAGLKSAIEQVLLL